MEIAVEVLLSDKFKDGINTMSVEPERLKKFLLEAELVSPKDFDEALKLSQENSQKIEDVLVAQELVTQDRLSKFEAYLLGVPFVNIEQETIPPEILSIIPEKIARAHNIVAFRKMENTVEVAMLDPEDLIAIESVKKVVPTLKILPRLTTPAGMKNALRQYQASLESTFGYMMKKPSKGMESLMGKAPDEFFEGQKDELLKAAQELPIIKLVDMLTKQAVVQRASDIHIEPLEQEVVVRFRVDGVLFDIMFLPVNISIGIVARIKVLSNLKLDEHRLPQDGRFKIETQDYKYSVRVSILPVFNGEKIVMRLLQEDVKTQTLEGLGFVDKNLEILKSNLNRPVGMILITGPTGSGKTTTLYSMMEILNKTTVNISTVEDPIEYRMPRINQTQVNAKIGLTFAAGLRSLVRQDPNVIMVGEVRDRETAGLAINAALTGHLVLSTLHTTEAAGAIPRLIDMKVEPFLISSTLNLIIAQRLVRKFAGERKKYKLTAEEVRDLAKYCDIKKIEHILRQENLMKEKEDIGTIDFYRPKSSDESKTGYKGRLAIVEVLPVTEEIKKLVIKKASTKEISSQAVLEGMKTMVEDGFVKAAKGLTSIEEVLRVIID